jgi:hypothetical protein
MHDRTLSDAMAAYVGQPGRLDVVTPEERVAVRIGEEAAADALPKVRAILEAMYSADPPLYDVATVAQLGEAATEWLRVNHPELSPAAVRATTNRFAFDWR